MNGCPGCSRRDFVRIAIGASAATGFAAKFGTPLAEGRSAAGKAKACILLWMDGAQSQLETWDPKPGTATGGPTRDLPTAAPGIRLSEQLARTAKVMDRVSLVRTLHSKDPNHDTASYLLHTGHRPAADLAHPHLGSMILEELGAGKSDLPGCIVLGGEPPAGAGYLPPSSGPLIFNALGQERDDIGNAPMVDGHRRRRRWALLKEFDREWTQRHADGRVEARRQAYERAWKVLDSAGLRAFRISEESEERRKAYGETPFGNAVLTARRLVESGVRFVEVQFGGWDTHNDNFEGHKRLLAAFDPAYSALMADLSRSGLLGETLVVVMSEFGRTPSINAEQGRDHWTKCWSAALAGGPMAGGRVVGRTDALGMAVEERPVSVGELHATIYSALGVDLAKKHITPAGRPMKVVEEGEPLKELFG